MAAGDTEATETPSVNIPEPSPKFKELVGRLPEHAPTRRILESLWSARGYQRGINYVQETGPAIIHRGETISPAGKDTDRGISIGNITIQVKEIADVDSVEKLGALLSQAEGSGIMRKGKTNYKLRIG